MTTPAPLDVSAWAPRIKAQCPSVKLAARSADHATAINEGPALSPAVFVLEPNYSAQSGGNYTDSLLMQLTHWLVPVLTCVRNVADSTGAAASKDLDTVRRELFAALVGFKPDPDGYTVRAHSGKLLTYKNGFVYYLDVFQLEYQLRNQ